MKRFFYFYKTEDGIKLGSLMSAKYADALQELQNNGVHVLFLSAYSTPLSRYIFKYLKLYFEVQQNTETADQVSDPDWKIAKPYLYYNTKKRSFEVSDEMLFGDYAQQLIGYVTDKAFQDVLIRNDF